MKISFANAISDLCERTGADVVHVINGMGHDRRIGHHHLQPGLGYGGSCFPKDVDSLIQTAHRFDYDFKLLQAVVDINRDRISGFVKKIETALGSVENKVFALFGLAFKPDTDDMREAKSIEVIEHLLAAKAKIRAYDPAATENARKIFGKRISYSKNAYEAAKDADAVILLTEWREFKQLNMERIRDSMKQPVLFDGRNLYNPERLRKIGFQYHGIGRRANSH
jgi:UDPglucose 6-dehydrogenase